MTDNELNAAITACRCCPNGSKMKIHAEGNGNNGVMVVLPAAALHAGELRLLSVAERQLLTLMLALFGIQLSACCLTSLVKCPTPHRNADMEQSCLPFLRAQFSLLRPKTIICFGESVCKRLIDPAFDLNLSHGKSQIKKGVRFVPTFTPHDALLNNEIKSLMLSDFTAWAEQAEIFNFNEET